MNLWNDSKKNDCPGMKHTCAISIEHIGITPPKELTLPWKIHHLKMYFLLNMGIFQCHVSFQVFFCMFSIHRNPPWMDETRMEAVLSDSAESPNPAVPRMGRGEGFHPGFLEFLLLHGNWWIVLVGFH